MLWTEKYYKVKGEHLDKLRCYTALLIEEITNQNYGNAKEEAIRINNVLGDILDNLEEVVE